MIGTNKAVTLPILLIPPKITSAINIVKTKPVTHVGTLNDDSIDVEIELDCTMLPIPNAAIAPNNANRIPSHLAFSPCSK